MTLLAAPETIKRGTTRVMGPPDHNGPDSEIRQQHRLEDIELIDEKSTTRVDGKDIGENKAAGAGGATTMGGTGRVRQEGWRELKEDGDPTTTAKKLAGGPSDDIENTGSIEIELQETGTTMRSVRTKLLGSGNRERMRGFLGFGIKVKTGHTGRAADYGNVVSVTASGSPGPDGVAPGGVGPAAGEEQWSGEYRVYKRRWFGLLQLMLLNIIASWDWLTFAPVSKNAAEYFGTDENTINWLSTAFFFSFVFIAPVVIYVLHFGPRPSIITSAALILAGNWIRYGGCHSGDGGNFGVVMFGQILTGLAQPFVLAAPARYSDLWFTTRGRVAATALTTLANPFGAALGQLIVPFWVSQPSDISRMVLYVSIISSICCIPSFFIPAAPPTPAAPSSETPKLSLRESAVILFGHLEFWLMFVAFSVYVGTFNSISSLLPQILQPYGYTYDEAGIAGAVLIVVGLVASAIFSPLVGRTRAYLTAIRVTVPIIGLSYLVFVWMPRTHDSGGLAGPYVVLALLGAASFSLMPTALEFLVELTHPISPEVTSTLALGGGQLLGGIFVVISGALKAGDDGDPPLNMDRALVFTAVIAMLAVIPPLCLGLFGRADKVSLRRVKSDERLARNEGSGQEENGQ